MVLPEVLIIAMLVFLKISNISKRFFGIRILRILHRNVIHHNIASGAVEYCTAHHQVVDLGEQQVRAALLWAVGISDSRTDALNHNYVLEWTSAHASSCAAQS